MLNLSDYFAPLNITTFSIYLGLFFFFDSLGTLIKSFIFKQKKISHHRLLTWLIGFGFFIFLWFVLSFFIPPRKIAILSSIVILSLVSFPVYLKKHHYKSLLSSIWNQKLVILVILPFLPAIFVKASLPPYYSDEMAYHFYSPFDAANIGTWSFNGGIYQNVPRTLDLFMILSFAITKTYSVFRLFHFSILATALLYSFKQIKRHFSLASALLLVIAFLSLPTDTVLTSTLGYVDVATYSFLLIAWVSAINFFFKRDPVTLSLSIIFWAMSLGTKYTGLTAVAAFSLPVFLFIIKHRPSFKNFIKPKVFLKLALIFLVFGGYWYFKNLYYYGNPTYPFLFPCLKYADQWCNGATSDFFFWTTKINLANFPEIIEGLFPANKFLQIMVLSTPLLVILAKKSKKRVISIWLLSSIILEFLLLKKFSGFYPRYQQHLELLLLLLLAIQIPNQYKINNLRTIAQGAFVVLFFTLLIGYISQIKYSSTLGFLSWTEINYARGKIDIHDWIDQKFPRVSQALEWCSNPPSGKLTPVARFDPDMIWYEYDGFMRSFMTNCNLINPPLDGLELDKVLPTAIESKMQFYTITPNPCLPQKEVKIRLYYEDDHMLYLRRLNNIVVCNSEQIRPNLYYFNYQTLL